MERQMEVIEVKAEDNFFADIDADRFWLDYEDVVGNSRLRRAAPFLLPIRVELLELVKYWYSVILDNLWVEFYYGETGGTEWRENSFGSCCISRLQQILGEESVMKAIKDAHEEFRESVIDQEAWKKFTEQWGREAFAEEMLKEINAERINAERIVEEQSGEGDQTQRLSGTSTRLNGLPAFVEKLNANPIILEQLLGPTAQEVQEVTDNPGKQT